MVVRLIDNKSAHKDMEEELRASIAAGEVHLRPIPC